MSDLIKVDRWTELRGLTRARIALGRSGSGLPTKPLLAFGVAHARARDAVYATLNSDALRHGLHALGLGSIEVNSTAQDRSEYLKRPDLGRQLDPASSEKLHSVETHGYDITLVIADGLCATAANSHALDLVQALQSRLTRLHIGPVVLARQARVALGDVIGEQLNAQLTIVLIGERPGLSATDSLGAYLTWQPRSGRSDAERNCVSNIRPDGLSTAEAAERIAFLVDGAYRLGATGVQLKDESDSGEPSSRRLKGADAPPIARPGDT